MNTEHQCYEYPNQIILIGLSSFIGNLESLKLDY